MDASWMPVYGSSHVIAVRYHEPSRECFVKFKNESVYAYENVSPETFQELVNASSKGKVVQLVLRRGGYKYRRVSDPDEKAIKSGGSSPRRDS